MTSIIKWLAVGYFTGFVCAAYLIARTIVTGKPQAVDAHLSEVDDYLSGNWFGMTLTSLVVSLGWSLVATGVYLLVGSDWVFWQFAALALLVVAAAVFVFNAGNKLDLIAVHTIVILGLGVLIPIVF